MSDFPVLTTGAVMQYPAERAVVFSTQVVRFLDGSEQRFREFSKPLHRWIIRLENLSELEMSSLREFFRFQDGDADPFVFTDPWDGTEYPDCSLETDLMNEEYFGPGQTRTTLIVKENR